MHEHVHGTIGSVLVENELDLEQFGVSRGGAEALRGVGQTHWERQLRPVFTRTNERQARLGHVAIGAGETLRALEFCHTAQTNCTNVMASFCFQ